MHVRIFSYLVISHFLTIFATTVKYFVDSEIEKEYEGFYEDFYIKFRDMPWSPFRSRRKFFVFYMLIKGVTENNLL